MFASQLGIRLMIQVGDVPRPPSYDTMAAISQVQVNTSDETGDGFQITLTLGKSKLQDYAVLGSGDIKLFQRIIIAVALGLLPEVLIDGVVTNHQVVPSNEPGMSTLTVTGTDISKMMDLEESNVQYQNQPSSGIVGQILSSYARYGLVPALTPTSDVQNSLEKVSWQRETDLRCIQRLAAENGYVFYTEPVSIGSSRAYWGPKVRSGTLQPALSIGMGGATNVKSLHFSEEALAAASIKASIMEPFSKTLINLPPLPPMHLPSLAPRPTTSKRVQLLRDTAGMSPAAAAQAMLSAMTGQPDTVSGSGEIDSVRYGRVLRARRLVGVRGAGHSYDGIYYVKSVSHTISRGAYSQGFSLSREGTGSLFPAVPV